MNLNDLAFVVNYILSSTREKKLSEYYAQLISLLNESSSAPTDEASGKIAEIKDQLVEAHMSISPKGWGYGRSNLFMNLRAEEMVGGGGAGTILSSFVGFSPPQELLKKVQGAATEVQKYIDDMSKLKASLGPAGEYKEESSADGKVLLEIVFDGEVQIKTISELSAQSRVWELVMSNYQRLIGNSQGTAEIVYLNKINPTILGLYVMPVLAHIFKETVQPILEVRNTWLEGQILVEQLKKIKMGGLLKDKADTAQAELKEKEVDAITKKLMVKYKDMLPKGSSEKEVSNFVKKNTEEIFDFIVKGGRIDVAADADGEFKVTFQLSDAYIKMSQLQSDVTKYLQPPETEEVKANEITEEVEIKENDKV